MVKKTVYSVRVDNDKLDNYRDVCYALGIKMCKPIFNLMDDMISKYGGKNLQKTFNDARKTMGGGKNGKKVPKLRKRIS